MKGTSFQKPFEFKLAVEGEKWNQGDLISGVLTVKNHGTEPLSLQGTQIALAYGDLDGVREKKPDAFEVQSSVPMSVDQKLDPQAEASFPWKFQTDRNCAISDKSSSLFLLYGNGAAGITSGQLQLLVLPVTLIQDFISLMTIEYKFVVKIQKFNKGCVEIKFTPPSSKNFAAVENLFVSFKFEGEQFHVRYLFNVKKLDASAGMTLKKIKKDISQSFGPSQYLLSNGRLNHEKVGAAIGEVIGQLGSLLTV